MQFLLLGTAQTTKLVKNTGSSRTHGGLLGGIMAISNSQSKRERESAASRKVPHSQLLSEIFNNEFIIF